MDPSAAVTCFSTHPRPRAPAAQVPAGSETVKLKVKISLNLHGLTSVEQVQAVEEVEEEVSS